MNHSLQKQRELFIVLKNKGLTEQRHEIINSFTGGRTESSKDLTDQEIDEFIILISNSDDVDKRYGSFDINNTQHKHILSLCHELGWTYYSKFRQKTTVDLKRLGQFVRSNHSKVQKPLMQQNKQELSVTIYQLEQITKKLHSKK